MKIFLLFLAISCCASAQKEMAVTFDDLPLSENGKVSGSEMQIITTRLVDKIRSFNIPAIGFVNEGKLYKHGVLDSSLIINLNIWIDNGLDLGNHTFSHKSLNSADIGFYKDDILKGEIITKQILSGKGKTPDFFRHPFLHTGLSMDVKNEIKSFLLEHGYKIAPVTIDNSEWIYSRAYSNALEKNDSSSLIEISGSYIAYMKDKIKYFEEQSRKLFGRNIKQILLVHANRLNADHFDKIAAMIQGLGYKFISLNEALTDEVYKKKDSYIKNNGISWIHRWAYAEGKRKDFFAGEPLVPHSILDIAGVESE